MVLECISNLLDTCNFAKGSVFEQLFNYDDYVWCTIMYVKYACNPNDTLCYAYGKLLIIMDISEVNILHIKRNERLSLMPNDKCVSKKETLWVSDIIFQT